MADNSKVMKCTCSNSFQDGRYGVGMRVFNKGREVWRCTSCAKEVRMMAGDTPSASTNVTPKKKKN